MPLLQYAGAFLLFRPESHSKFCYQASFKGYGKAQRVSLIMCVVGREQTVSSLFKTLR